MGTNDSIIGEREVYGRSRAPFGLSRQDRKQHLLCIGKSGVGKSTLMENLALGDIAAGMGVAFLDFHGDSIDNILERIPPARREDIVLFDASDVNYPVAFNPFDEVPAERRHVVASGLIEAFKGIWADSWGPRLDYILYAAFAAVLDCRNVSLLSVQRMLSDAAYRAWVVRQVKDPIVRAFWRDEFERYDKRFMAEAVAPIQNKIGRILMAPVLRNILGQVRSRIEPRFIMDRGKIFLAKLPKGLLGEDKAALLGALLASQFHAAAMSRADTPRDMRRDFALFVDEFGSLSGKALASILAETRKYGLSVVLATQSLSLLEQNVRDAALGNVGSIVAFRVGPDDAAILERAYGGALKAADFVSLDNATVAAKLLSGGKEQVPFFGRTYALPERLWRDVARMVKRARERYARARAEVESKIEKWSVSQRSRKTAGPNSGRRSHTYAKRRVALRSRKGPAERTVEQSYRKGGESESG